MSKRQRTGEWDYHGRIPEPSFRGTEVCALAGISFRQLDYWARTELVWPSVADARGSGSSRRWSREDVAYIRLIRELLDLGINLKRVRDIARVLRTSIDTCHVRPFLIVTPTSATAVAAADLVGIVQRAVSSVVLNLDEVCALDPEDDTDPVPAGPVRTTSDGVSTVAVPVG